MIKKSSLLVIFIIAVTCSAKAQWGENDSRTDTRDNASLAGSAGAKSGFYQTVNPINFPAGASSWWHLLDVRHTNPANNYAMQIAGSFYDQKLFFRKTNGDPNTGWTQFLTVDPVNGALSNEKVIAQTAGGQTFFTGHQLGGTYAFPDGIFRAITDNSNGLANLYYDGMTAGRRNYYVRADGQGYFAGSVIIGTTDAQGYQLAVNGAIRAKMIKVDVDNWPDYVFKQNYLLPSITSVKEFIKKNQHLPGMPSEIEVAKEGINLGEMNKLLIKKVEELTLYLIEQKADNERKLNLINKRIYKLTKQMKHQAKY
jgi:hypothetical protein